MTQITVDLSPQEYERLQRLAHYAQVSVSELLKDAARHYIPDVLVAVRDVSALPDQEVLKLAQATMDDESLTRWRTLRDAAPTGELTPSERAEMRELQETFWIGQFTKTEALIEAVRRGLMEPPAH